MKTKCSKCSASIGGAGTKSKSAWCKKCHSEYDKDRYRLNAETRKAATKANRLEVSRFVDDLKSKSPCTDCGRTFPAEVMEYDHLPGYAKSEVVSNYARTGRKRKFLEEIRKCEIVCANCHRIRTIGRRRKAQVQILSP